MAKDGFVKFDTSFFRNKIVFINTKKREVFIGLIGKSKHSIFDITGAGR